MNLLLRSEKQLSCFQVFFHLNSLIWRKICSLLQVYCKLINWYSSTKTEGENETHYTLHCMLRVCWKLGKWCCPSGKYKSWLHFYRYCWTINLQKSLMLFNPDYNHYFISGDLTNRLRKIDVYICPSFIRALISWNKRRRLKNLWVFNLLTLNCSSTIRL